MVKLTTCDKQEESTRKNRCAGGDCLFESEGRGCVVVTRHDGWDGIRNYQFSSSTSIQAEIEGASDNARSERTIIDGTDISIDGFPSNIELREDTGLFCDYIKVVFRVAVGGNNTGVVWNLVTWSSSGLVSNIAYDNFVEKSVCSVRVSFKLGENVTNANSRGGDGAEGYSVFEKVTIWLHDPSDLGEPVEVGPVSGAKTAEAENLVKRKLCLTVSSDVG